MSDPSDPPNNGDDIVYHTSDDRWKDHSLTKNKAFNIYYFRL